MLTIWFIAYSFIDTAKRQSSIINGAFQGPDPIKPKTLSGR